MSSIVYQINKKTGAKYAFESISYWDKDLKQPRSKRKYLGKVDPETGEIIPSRKRSSKTPEESAPEMMDELNKLYEEIKERDQMIEKLRHDLDDMTGKYEALLEVVGKIRVLTQTV